MMRSFGDAVGLKAPGNGHLLSDEDLVLRIVEGELDLFEVLMRRYNQRLFRVAHGIVRSENDAEDVVQQAYISAYLHLDQFDGRASFSTWLTRIAVHEALARVRAKKRRELTLVLGGAMGSDRRSPDPEQAASTRELAALFERAFEALPDQYRVVFMMRGVEEMSTAETAQVLGLSEEAVRVRFHRARARLQEVIHDRVGQAARAAFLFRGTRCNAMVASVLACLRPLFATAVSPTGTDSAAPGQEWNERSVGSERGSMRA